MEINPNQQEYIDRYLRGELQGQELDEFLELIKNDPAMASALKIQDNMAQGIEYHGNKELKKRLQKISAEVGPQKRRKNTTLIIRFIAIGAAAVIALLIISRLIFQQPDTEQLFAAYYEPAELSISRQTDSQPEIAQAENLYSRADYDKALPLLQNLLQKDPQNAVIQLALGNTLLNGQTPEQAIPIFRSIIEQNIPLYTDQAKWYLALTHLKMKNIEACKPLLQELANETDADFHQEAVKLLQDL